MKLKKIKLYLFHYVKFICKNYKYVYIYKDKFKDNFLISINKNLIMAYKKNLFYSNIFLKPTNMNLLDPKIIALIHKNNWFLTQKNLNLILGNIKPVKSLNYLMILNKFFFLKLLQSILVNFLSQIISVILNNNKK